MMHFMERKRGKGGPDAIVEELGLIEEKLTAEGRKLFIEMHRIKSQRVCRLLAV
jgi:hypothetical protein